MRATARPRAGAAHAAAEHVRRDDEETVGVDRLARTDHVLPPAGLAGHRLDLGDVLIPGQRMADQHGVAALGIQRAVGPVGDVELRQLGPAFELEAVHEGRDLVQVDARRFGMVHRRVHIGPAGGRGNGHGLPPLSVSGLAI
jgi:hypothetical protein